MNTNIISINNSIGVQKVCNKLIIRCKTILSLIILSMPFFVGCTHNDTDTNYPLDQTAPDSNNIQSDSHSENAQEENAIMPYIQFEMEDVIVEPAIQEIFLYLVSFTLNQVRGTLSLSYTKFLTGSKSNV